MAAILDFCSSHRSLTAFCVIALIGWVALAVATPMVIASLPADYFSAEEYLCVEGVLDEGAPPMRRVALVLRNIAACFLVFVAPILFQSIFAPLFGLMMANFKGKPAMLRRMASNKTVFRAMNSIRRRKGLEPFSQPVIGGLDDGIGRHPRHRA